jgi:tetratricopeptide (TPR) repeat protein
MSSESTHTPQPEAMQHLEQAYAHEEQNRFGQALSECDAAIRTDPTLAEAFNLRGIILEQLGRKAEAVSAYREALRLDPSFQEAEENLYELDDELATVTVNCPVCSAATDSLKRYRMPYRVIFFGIAARVKHGTYTGCPSCMRKKLLENVFSPLNILSANLLWLILVLPYNLVLFIASTTRGHSQGVRKMLGASQ